MTKAKKKPKKPKTISCATCDIVLEQPVPIEQVQPEKKSFCSLNCSLGETG